MPPRRRRVSAQTLLVVALTVAAAVAVYVALRAIPGPVRPTLGPPSSPVGVR